MRLCQMLDNEFLLELVLAQKKTSKGMPYSFLGERKEYSLELYFKWEKLPIKSRKLDSGKILIAYL